jgi:hypothetical protein
VEQPHRQTHLASYGKARPTQQRHKAKKAQRGFASLIAPFVPSRLARQRRAHNFVSGRVRRARREFEICEFREFRANEKNNSPALIAVAVAVGYGGDTLLYPYTCHACELLSLIKFRD